MAVFPHASSRRELIVAAGSLFAWSLMPRMARAEGRDPRLLVIVLRGGLDGLAAVAPVGDPQWMGLRGERALTTAGQKPALPLDGFFALNPAMPHLHRLFKAGQAAVVHAVATPYRERSHFDGQDVLENGHARPIVSETGWLNRAMATLDAGERLRPAPKNAFAVGPVTPLIARGPAPVIVWTPPRLMSASDDTAARLLDVYRHTDPELASALENRQRLVALARTGGVDAKPSPNAPQPNGAAANARAYFVETAAAAAKFMSQSDGPRVGAMSYTGWDTHIDEGIAAGQLANLLGALDNSLAALESGFGAAWTDTVVAVVTEFGRTAKINGTFGTDHGTGTIALLAGGAVKGGRVVADWPGLRDADLHEGRDLKPTADLRAVMKGVLRDHLRIEAGALASAVFPGSGDVTPLSGLIG